MDGQPDPQNNPGHSELPHDQAVPLRAAPQPTPLQQPFPAAPLPAPSPSYIPVVDSLPAADPILQQDIAETEYQKSQPVANPADDAPVLEGDLVQPEEYVTWTASEFVAHPKTTAWYGVLGLFAFGLGGLGLLLTRDVITAIVILLAAGLFGYTASRQPRELTYGLNSHGITVGPKLYPYNGFKSFSVSSEGHFSSLNFMPLKRFAPLLSVYYDPALEDRIMEVLSNHMPYVQHQRSLVDNLMHRIRF